MGNKQNKNGKRPLNEKEIQLFMNISGLNRQQVLDWHRDFLVENPEGFITKKKFVDCVKRLYSGFGGNPDKLAQFAFKAFDESNDGTVI
jgi:hypothetical protein